MAEGGIWDIIMSIILVAFGAAMAILVIAYTQTTFTAVVPSSNTVAIAAFNNTVVPIYSILPMLALVVLALIVAAVIGAFLVLRR